MELNEIPYLFIYIIIQLKSIKTKDYQLKKFPYVTCNLFQGVSKDGKTPDGTKYLDAAEKPEIKALLRSQYYNQFYTSIRNIFIRNNVSCIIHCDCICETRITIFECHVNMTIFKNQSINKKFLKLRKYQVDSTPLSSLKKMPNKSI